MMLWPPHLGDVIVTLLLFLFVCLFVHPLVVWCCGVVDQERGGGWVCVCCLFV